MRPIPTLLLPLIAALLWAAPAHALPTASELACEWLLEPQVVSMRENFRGEDALLTADGQRNFTPVAYLTDAELARFEIRFEGGRVVDVNGNPYSSDPSRRDLLVADFVVTPDGHWYGGMPNELSSVIAQTRPRSGYFYRQHHSSYSRGQPVAMAGGLLVRDGVILKLGNQSGHHPFGERRFASFLAWLVSEGADPHRIEVQVFSLGSSRISAEQYLRLRPQFADGTDAVESNAFARAILEDDVRPGVLDARLAADPERAEHWLLAFEHNQYQQLSAFVTSPNVSDEWLESHLQKLVDSGVLARVPSLRGVLKYEFDRVGTTDNPHAAFCARWSEKLAGLKLN